MLLHRNDPSLKRSGTPVSQTTIVESPYMVVKTGIAAETIRTEGRPCITRLLLPGDLFCSAVSPPFPLPSSVEPLGTRTHMVPLQFCGREDEHATVHRALLINESIRSKWLALFQSRSAFERFAHLLCELRFRIRQIGQDCEKALRTPLTHAHLSAILGIHTVHASRIVAQYRESGLAVMRRGTFYCEDWRELERLARFDVRYLCVAPAAAAGV